MEYGTRMKGLKTGQFVDGRSGSLKTKDKEFGALCVFRIRNNEKDPGLSRADQEVSQ